MLVLFCSLMLYNDAIYIFLKGTIENTSVSYLKGKGKTDQNDKAEDKSQQPPRSERSNER